MGAKKEFPHGYFDGGGEGPESTGAYTLRPMPSFNFGFISVLVPCELIGNTLVPEYEIDEAYEIEIGNICDGDRWREPKDYGAGAKMRKCTECIDGREAVFIMPTTEEREIYTNPYKFWIRTCQFCHGTGRVAVKEE